MLAIRLIILAHLLCSIPQADDVLSVVCYGDSITAADRGWVSKVDRTDSIETINAGRGGRRAANARAELLPYLEKLSGERVDRIVLCLGVNDLPARDKRPGEEKLAICVEGLREAIDLSLERFSAKQIVLVAPCSVNPVTMSDTNLKKGYDVVQPWLEKLEAAYRKLAEEKGIRFVSLLRVVSKENFTDGLHPNDAGHEEIAKVMRVFLLKP